MKDTGLDSFLLHMHLPYTHTGTWAGIQDNLDLLQDMGMSAVSVVHASAHTQLAQQQQQQQDSSCCQRRHISRHIQWGT